jgi:hypothetical protein
MLLQVTKVPFDKLFEATQRNRTEIIEMLESEELKNERIEDLKSRIRQEATRRKETEAENLISRRIAHAVAFVKGELEPDTLSPNDQGRIKYTLDAAYKLLSKKVAGGEDRGPSQRPPDEAACLYRAPEQSIKDLRCDIFSLGLVYAESFCTFSDDVERKEVLHRPGHPIPGPDRRAIIGPGGALWTFMGWQSIPQLEDGTIQRFNKCCKLGSNDHFSDDVKLLRRMLSERVEDRPHAREIVASQFLIQAKMSVPSRLEIENLQAQLKKEKDARMQAEAKVDDHKKRIAKLTKKLREQAQTIAEQKTTITELKIGLREQAQTDQQPARVDDQVEPDLPVRLFS